MLVDVAGLAIPEDCMRGNQAASAGFSVPDYVTPYIEAKAR